MNHSRTTHNRRFGISLLEITVSTAIVGLIVTAAAVSVRTSQGIWTEYGGDAAKLDAMHATALHLVRQLRQCVSVTSISTSAETNGSVSALNAAGQTLSWTTSGGNVTHGIDASSGLLSSDITSLVFTAYESDGVTTTTNAADIRSVAFVISVQLDRNVNPNRSIRSRVWLRAW